MSNNEMQFIQVCCGTVFWFQRRYIVFVSIHKAFLTETTGNLLENERYRKSFVKAWKPVAADGKKNKNKQQHQQQQKNKLGGGSNN